ncbi:hypothetical protein B7463_g9282, partial [Scytalidium lignicola]
MSPMCLNRSRHHQPLRDLEEQLTAIKANELGQAGLRHFKVIAKQVDLDENGIPSPEFSFFLPCKVDLPPVDDDRIGMSFIDFDTPRRPGQFALKDIGHARGIGFYFLGYLGLCETDVQGQDRGNWAVRQIIDYPFEMPLLGMKPEWQVIDISDVDDQEYPHLRCVMIYDSKGEDGKLLRGEILALTRLTTERLETEQSKQHIKAPILMFSFMGPQHGRMLQAFFDGKRLVVNYTKIYDFRTKNIAGLSLFARWGIGKPTGDTKDPSLLADAGVNGGGGGGAANDN